jgi:hypothetical protein
VIESELLGTMLGYVNGRWVAAESGKAFEVINPVDGDLCATVSDRGERGAGAAIPGFTTGECDEVMTKDTDQVVTWNVSTTCPAWPGAPCVFALRCGRRSSTHSSVTARARDAGGDASVSHLCARGQNCEVVLPV